MVFSSEQPLARIEVKEDAMVLTVLEAHVPTERLSEVERVFSEGTAQLPPEILATYMVRDTKDPTLFRLNTFWRTREDLDRMRNSGEKPKGVVMFEAVGAKPTLSIFDVVVQRTHATATAF
jgi:heme-degrading monooxygenase HmoA